MIAVLFGTFNAKHAANVLLVEDLERAGFEVRVCHAPLWEEERDKHATYFSPGSLARLAVRWLRLMARLAIRFKYAAAGADLVVAGFNGQLDVLVARLLTGRRRKVLFVPLVTITETLIDDRERYSETSLVGRLVRWLDRASFRAADVALLDTKAHRDYVVQRLGVAPERVAVQYLGAPSLFSGALPLGEPHRRPGTRLKVITYCTFLPLHGTRVIAEAARLISPSEGIELELIGSGPEWASCEDLVGRLPHVSLVDWLPYAELPARIAAADVALGIFGSTAKARFVIPNKIFQAAEIGRAVITADTPAIREVFVPGDSILAIEPDPGALAGALRSLASDSQLRRRIGERGRRAVEQAAGADVRARRLRELLGGDADRAGAG